MIRHFVIGGAVIAAASIPVSLPAAAPAATTTLTLNISGFRNNSGNVLICVTRQPRHFPNCSVDPAGLKIKVAAKQASKVVFKSVTSGTWAVAMLHDENANSKMDTTASLPDEGFGFSRNPVVYRTAPKFNAAAVKIGTTPAALNIRLQYLL